MNQSIKTDMRPVKRALLLAASITAVPVLLFFIEETAAFIGLPLPVSRSPDTQAHLLPGIVPRDPEFLSGVLFAPFLHGDTGHLFSNTPPLFLALWGVLYLYYSSALAITSLSFLVPGLAVWVFAPDHNMHIGASGWIYSMLSFLFWSGIIRKQRRAIALSLIIVFLYGGMVWGVLPAERGVSWESHLAGAVTGLLIAILFRRSSIEPIDEDAEIAFDDEQ